MLVGTFPSPYGLSLRDGCAFLQTPKKQSPGSSTTAVARTFRPPWLNDLVLPSDDSLLFLGTLHLTGKRCLVEQSAVPAPRFLPSGYSV